LEPIEKFGLLFEQVALAEGSHTGLFTQLLLIDRHRALCGGHAIDIKVSRVLLRKPQQVQLISQHVVVVAQRFYGGLLLFYVV
jgi:hypothetical protein